MNIYKKIIKNETFLFRIIFSMISILFIILSVADFVISDFNTDLLFPIYLWAICFIFFQITFIFIE